MRKDTITAAVICLILLTHPITVHCRECTLYLAPSTTCPAKEGHEGSSCLGLYAGVPIPANTNVNHPEIAIEIFAATDGNHPLFGNIFKGGIDDKANLIIPGVGMVPTQSEDVINTEVLHGQEATYFPANSKGEGCFTEFYNVSLRTRYDVEAGDELFFKTKDKAKRTDYSDAADAVRKFKAHVERLTKSGDMTDEIKYGMYDLIRKTVVEDNVRKFLPPVDRLDEMLESEHPDRFLGVRPNYGLDYLRDNAYCVDVMRADVSTIPDAGRGAFATVEIERGEVVAPFFAKLLLRKDLIVNGDYEMLLNYCFGHRDSDLLLYPISPIVNYINHGRNGNIKLEWPSEQFVGFYNADDWAESTIEDILESTSPMIMYEIVATRDIAPGEELLLDYGADWEKAWKHYSDNWIPEYPSVMVWNAKKAAGMPVRTSEENPYPPNVLVGCFVDMGDIDQMVFSWSWNPDLYTDHNLYYCQIKDRVTIENGDGYWYTVEIDFDDGDTAIIDQVPHDAIWFGEQDLLYKRKAFRHHIGIPDEFFPSLWTRMA